MNFFLKLARHRFDIGIKTIIKILIFVFLVAFYEKFENLLVVSILKFLSIL